MLRASLGASFLVTACSGASTLTTQAYDGAATYSGATTGSSPAHVVVEGFPQPCGGPESTCVGDPLTITIGECSLQGRVQSLSRVPGGLGGFTATVNPGQTCALSIETIDVTNATLTSTFSTLNLSISGESTATDSGPAGAFFTWSFVGNGPG